MKKILTILLILTFATVGAFAATTSETHSLTVQLGVAELVPAFQLTYGTTTTNTAPTRFINEASYDGGTVNISDKDTATDSTDLSKGYTFTFYGNIASAGKIVKAYTLNFQETGFAVKKNGTNATVTAGFATLAGTDVTNVTMSGASAGTGTNGKSITATFDGGTSGTGTIATYTLVYSADDDIDPGTYTNTITMTVSAS